MPHSVSGIAANEARVQSVAAQLRSAGFSDADISLLFPNEVERTRIEVVNATKAPEGAAIGAGTGGAVGAALGWLVGIGTIAIPGLGPLIAAGPILAALSGVAAGATVGGLTGLLVGLGVPEYEAKVYARKLQEGHYLISVRCRTDEEIDVAEKILKSAGTTDVSSTRSAIAGT
ncbi:MAG: hypothetical protein ACM3U2_03765 [Deltaproteobacteria bacterium]